MSTSANLARMSDERLSNTKIDKLGDRLRQRNVADDDLRLLDAYRRSFGKAYETVVGAVREKLSLEPTGRRFAAPVGGTFRKVVRFTRPIH